MAVRQIAAPDDYDKTHSEILNGAGLTETEAYTYFLLIRDLSLVLHQISDGKTVSPIFHRVYLTFSKSFLRLGVLIRFHAQPSCDACLAGATILARVKHVIDCISGRHIALINVSRRPPRDVT